MLWRVNLYFILPPGWMPPWLWHCRPSPPRLPPSLRLSVCPINHSHPSSLLVFLAQASSLSSGGGSIWQLVSGTAMATAIDGQESIWTHARGPSHTHTHTPRDTAFTILHITIPPVPQIGVVVVMVLPVAAGMGGGVTWCCCFTPECHPSALERLPL